MAAGASAGAGNYPIPDIYQEQDNFEQADLSGFDEDIEISTDNQPSSADAQAYSVDEKTQMFNPQAGAFTQIEGFDQPPALDVYLYDAMRDVAYTLTGQPERIGREEGNEIVVPDINASRVHAEIRMEPDGSWVIADLASTNGLYINGRKIKSAPLRDADIITIGTTELEFQQLA
jgi:pSer/pThr/pTyr-binding forkhead associated (FHA) protein